MSECLLAGMFLGIFVICVFIIRISVQIEKVNERSGPVIPPPAKPFRSC